MGNTDDEITYAVGSHISPNRYVVKDLESVRKIIISPETKKLDTSYRFRKCKDKEELDSFFEDISSLSISQADATTAISTGFVEPASPYSEPPLPNLNKFKKAIERKNDKVFDDSIDENPRFILNTGNDGPTIVQGSQRHNALHIACINGNLHAVNRIFELLDSKEFLMKAYGKIDDANWLNGHLLDCFINTPDKNANNTPLHFASKNGHVEIVKKLLSYDVCQRDPVNSFELAPADFVCESFKGTAEEKAKAKSEIMKLFHFLNRKNKD